MPPTSESYLRAVAKVEPKSRSTITSQVHCIAVSRTLRHNGKPKVDSPVAVLNSVDAGHYFRLVYSPGMAATLATQLLLCLPDAERALIMTQVIDGMRGKAGAKATHPRQEVSA